MTLRNSTAEAHLSNKPLDIKRLIRVVSRAEHMLRRCWVRDDQEAGHRACRMVPISYPVTIMSFLPLVDL